MVYWRPNRFKIPCAYAFVGLRRGVVVPEINQRENE
jgi:hypothetical protein